MWKASSRQERSFIQRQIHDLRASYANVHSTALCLESLGTDCISRTIMAVLPKLELAASIYMPPFAAYALELRTCTLVRIFEFLATSPINRRLRDS